MKKTNSLLRPALIILAFLFLVFMPGCSQKADVSKAKQLYDKAFELTRYGKFDEALKLAKEAEAADKNNIDNQVLLARLYLEKSDTRKAAGAINNVLKLAPEDGRAMSLLITIAEDEREFQKVTEIANKILSRPGATPDLKKDAYISLGQVGFFRQDYETAEKYYNLALKANPEDRSTLLHLAKLAEATNRYDKFWSIMKEAEKYKDTFERENIREFYHWMGHAYVSRGDTDKALENYKKALDMDSGDSYARIHVVWMYMEKLDYDNAVKYFGDLPKTSPYDDYVVEALTNLYCNQGRYYRAVKVYENAIGKNKERFNMSWGIGRLYIELGLYDKAGEVFNYYTGKFPRYSEGHIGQAMLSLAKGDEKKSEEIYKEWGQKLPEHRLNEKYFNRAVIYLRHLGSLEKAEENLKEYMKRAPSDPYETLLLMATLRLKQNRPQEAEEYIKKAIQRAKPEYFIYLEAAGVYASAGNADKAVEYINKAKPGIDKLSPPVRAGMYFRCAFNMWGLGKPDEAQKYAEESLSLDPGLVDSMVLLSYLNSEKGDKEKAAALIDQALKLEPENEQAIFAKNNPDKINPFMYHPK